MGRVLPPRPYRVAVLVITHIWRSGCIDPSKMMLFHRVTGDILAALMPADLRKINSGRWRDHDDDADQD